MAALAVLPILVGMAAGLTKKVITPREEEEDKAARSQRGIRKRTTHELAKAGACL
jgi:hypothetical protein